MQNGGLRREVVICIPGLGGHRTSLSEYKALLPGRELQFVEVVDHRAAQTHIAHLCDEADAVIFLCNCYGLQLALRAAARVPGKVRALVVVEAFFPQFHAWPRAVLPVNRALLAVVNFFIRLGVRRSRLWTGIDYGRLARYPLFVQPFFDMLWQGLDDYLRKIEDALTYRLPERIDTPTLFILSPNGYFTNGEHRKEVQRIFTRSEIVEIYSKSHNLVSLAAPAIAATADRWLARL